MVAPFTDVKSLTATYRIGGTIPLLEPVARVLPTLLEVLNTNFIRDKWPSRDRLAAFVRACEEMPPAVVGKCDYHYRIHIIHAQDDYDIPWSHGEQMLWSAVNATTSKGISFEELEREKEVGKTVLGERGWFFSRETERRD